jgi:predicted metal-dependent phosphoesterase TrpH
MVACLRELGAPVSYEQVADLSGGGSIGRPHVARALVDVGFVQDARIAFRDYIGRGCPAFAERYRLTAKQACRAVRAAGGVPVVAHPVPPPNPWSDPKGLRRFLPSLVDAGLGGLECYYPGYSPRVIRWLETLAWHFGLVPTGGSDYHGPWRADRRIGCVRVPQDVPERLRAAAAAIPAVDGGVAADRGEGADGGVAADGGEGADGGVAADGEVGADGRVDADGSGRPKSGTSSASGALH